MPLTTRRIRVRPGRRPISGSATAEPSRTDRHWWPLVLARCGRRGVFSLAPRVLFTPTTAVPVGDRLNRSRRHPPPTAASLSAGNNRVHAGWSKTSSDILLSYYHMLGTRRSRLMMRAKRVRSSPVWRWAVAAICMLPARLSHRCRQCQSLCGALDRWRPTWSANARVDEPATPTIGIPALAASGTLLCMPPGGVFRHDWSIYYDRSTDGGLTWGSDQVLAQKGYMDGGAFAPDAATNGSNVYVVWDASISGYPPNILLRRSTTNGPAS